MALDVEAVVYTTRTALSSSKDLNIPTCEAPAEVVRFTQTLGGKAVLNRQGAEASGLDLLPNGRPKRLREALGDSPENPKFIETIPRRGYRFLAKLNQGAKCIRLLAVLPLENLSRDPEQEYFCRGADRSTH